MRSTGLFLLAGQSTGDCFDGILGLRILSPRRCARVERCSDGDGGDRNTLNAHDKRLTACSKLTSLECRCTHRRGFRNVRAHTFSPHLPPTYRPVSKARTKITNVFPFADYMSEKIPTQTTPQARKPAHFSLTYFVLLSEPVFFFRNARSVRSRLPLSSIYI